MYTILCRILVSFSKVSAVNILVPNKWTSDDYYIPKGSSSIITSDGDTITRTIQTVNQYLRYWLWLVLLIIIIVSWLKIIFSNGNKEILKKNLKIMWYSLIWLVVAILSYVIVRIVINLF